MPPLARLWRRARRRRDLARIGALLPAILATVPAMDAGPPPAAWRVRQMRWTDTGMLVVVLGGPERPAAAVLRLPHTGEDAARLIRHNTALAGLHDDPRLARWRGALPRPLASGTLGGQTYAVEQALSGQSGLALLRDPAGRARMLRSAASLIGELHRCTATTMTVDGPCLARWAGVRLPLLRRLAIPLVPAARVDRAIEWLDAFLRRALLGRPLAVGWIHGDCWPGNLLVDRGGGVVTGITDWEWAADGEVPAHDLLHLALYTRSLVERRDLGRIVRDLLAGATRPGSDALMPDCLPLASEEDVTRALLLLYWLRHVTANLEQSSAYAADRPWIRNNVLSVLSAL